MESNNKVSAKQVESFPQMQAPEAHNTINAKNYD